MKIHVLGGNTSKFGELWDTSPRELGRQTMKKALQSAGIEARGIDALFVGNMLSGIFGNQENLGAFYAEELGVQVPAFRLEAACASGGLALHSAVNALLAGIYETVMVLGIEKMTDHQQDVVSSALMAAGSDEERQTGITFPGLYALLTQAYMQEYGMTEADLAAVAVKNHYHGSHNPNAQFRFPVTVEQVLLSAKVADPLKLLDCSPISDGASAVILSTKKHKSKVEIIASTMATDTLSLSDRSSFTSLGAVVRAAAKAYKAAGIQPKDVDVAEIHDCFSIAEVIASEDLGFSKKGHGALDIASGKRTLGSGEVILNSSGGLKACGHPVGATGVKQMVEIMEQLQGKAGDRQVHKAKVGLTHNVAGSGSQAVIHILKGSI